MANTSKFKSWRRVRAKFRVLLDSLQNFAKNEIGQSKALQWRPYHTVPVHGCIWRRRAVRAVNCARGLKRGNRWGCRLSMRRPAYRAIERMRYVPGDDSGGVEGVRALGRALEHMNLSWALAGIALRLPIIWQSVEPAMDASGLGRRNLGGMSTVRLWCGEGILPITLSLGRRGHRHWGISAFPGSGQIATKRRFPYRAVKKFIAEIKAQPAPVFG